MHMCIECLHIIAETPYIKIVLDLALAIVYWYRMNVYSVYTCTCAHTLCTCTVHVHVGGTSRCSSKALR